MLTRVAVVLALSAPSLPAACEKVGIKGAAKEEPSAPEPAPVPVTSATAPPMWSPPAPPPEAPPPAVSADPRAAELARLTAAAAAGEHKKVKAALDKRVRAGKATDQEAALLYQSCQALKDKACVAAVRAKHPSLGEP